MGSEEEDPAQTHPRSPQRGLHVGREDIQRLCMRQSRHRDVHQICELMGGRLGRGMLMWFYRKMHSWGSECHTGSCRQSNRDGAKWVVPAAFPP